LSLTSCVGNNIFPKVQQAQKFTQAMRQMFTTDVQGQSTSVQKEIIRRNSTCRVPLFTLAFCIA
jgi:hypothetical protein